MVSFIKPSAAANMKQYLMPSYGEIMKHALTCKAIGAEVCSSVWCEFVLVKVNMNQLGVILYLNMYVCKFEPIQHVFRQKAFCKESILFHSYTLFYSLQRGQGIFIAINYTHVFSGDPYEWHFEGECPIVAAYDYDEPCDVVILSVRANKDGGLTIIGDEKNDRGNEHEIEADDIFAGHMDFITSEIGD